MEVAEKFKLKNDNIELPEVYLVRRFAKNVLNGKDKYSMSSVDNVKAILKNIDVRLKKEEVTSTIRNTYVIGL